MLCLVLKSIKEINIYIFWFYNKKYIYNFFLNIIKISKRKLYIFKLFNVYIKDLNELNKFKIRYKNNLLILNLLFYFSSPFFQLFFARISSQTFQKKQT